VFLKLLKIDPATGNVINSYVYEEGGIWGTHISTSDGGILMRTGAAIRKVDFMGNPIWSVRNLFGTTGGDHNTLAEAGGNYYFATQDNVNGTVQVVGLNESGGLIGRVIVSTNGFPSDLDPLSDGNLGLVVEVADGIEFYRFTPDLQLVSSEVWDEDYSPTSLERWGEYHLLTGVEGGTLQPIMLHLTPDLRVGCSMQIATPAISTNSLPMAADVTTPASLSFTALDADIVIRNTQPLAIDYICNPTVNVNLGQHRDFCQGTPLGDVDGREFETYIWSNGATTPEIIPQVSGVYWLFVSNGCGYTDSDTVTLNVLPNASIPSQVWSGSWKYI
jgi:hypothetical protein